MRPQYNTTVVLQVVTMLQSLQQCCKKWQQQCRQEIKTLKSPVDWFSSMTVNASLCSKQNMSRSSAQADSSRVEPLLPSSNELGVPHNVNSLTHTHTPTHTHTHSFTTPPTRFHWLKANTRVGGVCVVIVEMPVHDIL